MSAAATAQAAPRYITQAESGRRLGVGRDAIQRFIRLGLLQKVDPIAGEYAVVLESSVEDLVRRRNQLAN